MSPRQCDASRLCERAAAFLLVAVLLATFLGSFIAARAADQIPQIVPSSFDAAAGLTSSIQGEKVMIDWSEAPGFFLFSKETGSDRFEMIQPGMIPIAAGKAHFEEPRQKQFFQVLQYTLGATFSFTANWAASSRPGVFGYQVFYVGTRGFSYSITTDAATFSLRFDHLDPTKAPWKITVYELAGRMQYKLAEMTATP